MCHARPFAMHKSDTSALGWCVCVCENTTLKGCCRPRCRLKGINGSLIFRRCFFFFEDEHQAHVCLPGCQATLGVSRCWKTRRPQFRDRKGFVDTSPTRVASPPSHIQQGRLSASVVDSFCIISGWCSALPDFPLRLDPDLIVVFSATILPVVRNLHH